MLDEKRCPNCAGKSFGYRLKLIPTNRPDIRYFPVYVPQVKKICEGCGRFLAFAKQEEWLIRKINDKFGGVAI